MDSSQKTKVHKSITVLALIALFTLYAWTRPNPALAPSPSTTQSTDVTHTHSDTGSQQMQALVCGRAANDIGSAQDLALQQQYTTCPEFDTQTPIVVLEGHKTYGRTANQLRSFLSAVQYARDNQFQLGIMYDSWPIDLILPFFMANGEGTWDAQVLEAALCIKIIHKLEELEGRQIIQKNGVELFYYLSSSPPEQYVASQLHTLRTLFQHYNTGDGIDHNGERVGNMCSGIYSLFGQEDQNSAVYSVIHLRKLDGGGEKYMKVQAASTGCDPMGALEMRPDYIKSILAPLDMLKHPIVVITDGKNVDQTMQRLKADPQIGPMIRLVSAHPEACWIGGDITLATMANVFIGNPASTFSTFIARSRKALGFGDNYLYRMKNENGEWTTSCGDECLFKNSSGHSESHFDKARISLHIGQLIDARTRPERGKFNWAPGTGRKNLNKTKRKFGLRLQKINLAKTKRLRKKASRKKAKDRRTKHHARTSNLVQ